MRVRCTIMRGGTSKAVFIPRDALPADPGEWDGVVLRILGSPDRRQIDGLGGADLLTSKVPDSVLAGRARAAAVAGR
jgi:2-methylaconitate cis-trans-isomerase PrpF